MKNTNRILVVSDKEPVRRGYLQPLDSIFHNVEFVSDEDCAMAAMEQRAFDLVLLDVWKPGADGLAALRSIKRRWPQSEVVIITNTPTVANAKEAVRLGAYDYVPKPISPLEIINLATCALTQKAWTIHREPSLASVTECCRAKVQSSARRVANDRANSFRGRELLCLQQAKCSLSATTKPH